MAVVLGQAIMTRAMRSPSDEAPRGAIVSSAGGTTRSASCGSAGGRWSSSTTLRPAVLRGHAHPAAAAALVGARRDRAVVRRPPLRPALRLRDRLHRGRRDGDHERDARLFDAAHVGEPRVRVLLPRDLRARDAAGHAAHGRRVHGRRHATRPRSRAHELALRLRVPVVRRHDGRVPGRLPGLDGRDPARQEPRVPEVVRLPQSLQRAHGGRRRTRVDLQARRLRLGRRDRVVDRHGRVRHLHRPSSSRCSGS